MSISGASFRHLKTFFLSGLMLSIVITFSSCDPDFEIVFAEEEPLDSNLELYYDRFVYEAYQRGLDVEYTTSQVEGRIADITEENVIGTCSWTQNHSHNITIDQNYWRTANDLQREFVVFHELGHCVLGKDHVDGEDANGQCISIMTSGTGDCRVVYSPNNRNRLLDELFSNL